MPRVPILLVIATLGASPAATVDRMKPDFSAVRSVAAAEALVATGKLVRITLFPAELGGEDRAENRSYVTPAAAVIRARLIGTIQRMLRGGSVDQLTVTPVYKGDSLVPSRLVMKAWHTGKSGSFEPDVDVW